jgi:hypothetical protein
MLFQRTLLTLCSGREQSAIAGAAPGFAFSKRFIGRSNLGLDSQEFAG